MCSWAGYGSDTRLLVSQGKPLLHPNYGHVFLVEPAPALAYQICSEDTRMLIDIPENTPGTSPKYTCTLLLHSSLSWLRLGEPLFTPLAGQGAAQLPPKCNGTPAASCRSGCIPRWPQPRPGTHTICSPNAFTTHSDDVPCLSALCCLPTTGRFDQCPTRDSTRGHSGGRIGLSSWVTAITCVGAALPRLFPPLPQYISLYIPFTRPSIDRRRNVGGIE